VPTPSGYGTVRAVEAETAERVLRALLQVAPERGRVVHCCAADPPLALLRTAGADALSLDASLLKVGHYDALGEAIEAGTSLWLGVLPTTDQPLTSDGPRERIRGLWSALGFPLAQLPTSLVLTPACGLAGASPAYARRVFAVLRELGSWLVEAESEE
jgi:hypothetical protein